MINKKRLPSGLMIRDASDRPVQQKIVACILRFRDKFGIFPSVIWLHAETLGNYVGPNGFKLVTSQYCRPNVFLIGPLPKGK